MSEWYDWWQNYNKYLRSDDWRQRRVAVMARADGACERDGCSRAAVHVHHKTYANLRNEPLEDLEALCFECHQAEHPNHKIGTGRAFYAKKDKKKKGKRAKGEKVRGERKKRPRETPCPFCTKKFPDVLAVRVHAKSVHVYDLKNGKPGRRQRGKHTGKKPYTGPQVFL